MAAEPSDHIDNRGGFDMATRTTHDTNQLVQELEGVVDQLISLQSLDHCMNGYLKQRSKGHMFTVISNATDLALERYRPCGAEGAPCVLLRSKAYRYGGMRGSVL